MNEDKKLLVGALFIVLSTTFYLYKMEVDFLGIYALGNVMFLLGMVYISAKNVNDKSRKEEFTEYEISKNNE